MQGDYRKLGIWLAGSGVTLAGLYLVSSASSGHKTPFFPYWIFLGLFMVAGCIYLWSALQARLMTKTAEVEVAGELPKPDESAQAEKPLYRLDPTIGMTLPVVTDRWRYTQVGFEVSTLANIGTKGFTHPSYMRQTQEGPPAVRIGMLVACSPLGDEPTPEALRSRFRDLLGGDRFMDLIAELTDIRPDTAWKSQPGRGRFYLEADLTGDAPAEVPVASAMLNLPIAGQSFYGRDPKCAELVVHVDLPMKDGEPVIGGLPEWHRRFTRALALPAELARFLEGLGLTTSDDPPVKFAIQVQARPITAGMTEIVDVSLLRPISGGRMSVQFDGWAVAEANGKTAGAIARSLLREMCEGMGREGYEEILVGLPE